VIPEPTSAALRSFAMDIHDHRASSPTASAIASMAGPCLECEMAGWCRWPTDTARVR
jgi:hypothetical protein